MLVQPIDYFLIVWFALAGISSVYVAWDQFENNPEPAVMKWAFVLITLYLGPIGLLLYVLADKEPKPGTHEQFTRPIWKQGVGSTIAVSLSHSAPHNKQQRRAARWWRIDVDCSSRTLSQRSGKSCYEIH
jgi:hypothetical protein